MSRRASAGMVMALGCAALWAQDFSRVDLAKLGAGYQFTEGAAWSKDGYLIFSNTPQNQLLKWVPGQQPEVFRRDVAGPEGNAFDSEGRLYTCESRARRVTRTAKNGKVEVLAERWEGKQLNAPAGIAVSNSGHVYFTDPAFGYQSDHRELDFYGVYHIAPNGMLRLVAKPEGRPHGIALSPNGRILYVSNADEHNIRAYDVARNGDTSNERILISQIAGVPGGLSVDKKGNLYVAGDGIAIYDPEGHLLHTIEMSEPASSCAIGGPDLESLFVTARGNVYRARPAEK